MSAIALIASKTLVMWNSGTLSEIGLEWPVWIGMEKTFGTGSFGPQAIAVEYYFGDLSYWQLPAICIQAMEHGFDGRALRAIAGLVNLAPVRGRLLTETDIRRNRCSPSPEYPWASATLAATVASSESVTPIPKITRR